MTGIRNRPFLHVIAFPKCKSKNELKAIDTVTRRGFLFFFCSPVMASVLEMSVWSSWLCIDEAVMKPCLVSLIINSCDNNEENAFLIKRISRGVLWKRRLLRMHVPEEPEILDMAEDNYDSI